MSHQRFENIYIRPMQEKDIPAVQEIDRMSFSLPWPPGAYDYEISSNKNSTSPGKQQRSGQWVAVINLASALDETSPRSRIEFETTDPGLRKTPTQQEKIIGMAVVWYIVDEVHIATLAVHPDYRQQGVAQKLLEIILQEAMRHGFLTVTLEVRAGNLSAQALYRKFGFQIVGTRPRYYKNNNEDAYIMTLKEIALQYGNLSS